MIFEKKNIISYAIICSGLQNSVSLNSSFLKDFLQREKIHFIK